VTIQISRITLLEGVRNTAFMRKLKDISILNTVEALGIIPGVSSTAASHEDIRPLWGG
jgi:hypothetical protein